MSGQEERDVVSPVVDGGVEGGSGDARADDGKGNPTAVSDENDVQYAQIHVSSRGANATDDNHNYGDLQDTRNLRSLRDPKNPEPSAGAVDSGTGTRCIVYMGARYLGGDCAPAIAAAWAARTRPNNTASTNPYTDV